MNYIERRSFGMEEIQKYKPKPVYSFDGINTVLTITRNVILSKENIKQITDNLKEEEKKAYEYLKRETKTSKSEYATYAQIDDKKAQRIFKKLVDLGLVTTEGSAKATKYIIATIDTIDE